MTSRQSHKPGIGVDAQPSGVRIDAELFPFLIDKKRI